MLVADPILRRYTFNCLGLCCHYIVVGRFYALLGDGNLMRIETHIMYYTMHLGAMPPSRGGDLFYELLT